MQCIGAECQDYRYVIGVGVYARFYVIEKSGQAFDNEEIYDIWETIWVSRPVSRLTSRNCSQIVLIYRFLKLSSSCAGKSGGPVYIFCIPIATGYKAFSQSIK